MGLVVAQEPVDLLLTQSRVISAVPIVNPIRWLLIENRAMLLLDV